MPAQAHLGIQAERTVRATRAQVWAALTSPRLLARWLAPPGQACKVLTFEARAGAPYRMELTATDGGRRIARGTVTEAVPGRRLVLTWGVQEPASRVVWELTEVAGGTKVSVRQTGGDADALPRQLDDWRAAMARIPEALASA